MNDQSEVIVLQNRDYRDADAILNVLSKDQGKLTFVARGIRKANSKNMHSCSAFNVSRFHYNFQEQRTMQSLKTAESIQNFRQIRENLVKQSIAFVMVEVMDKIHIEFVEEAYSLLLQSLTYLEKTTNELALLGLYFAKVCEICGIAPYVDGCVNCQTQHNLATISLLEGGFVCRDCMNPTMQIKKDITTLKFFRLFNKAAIEQFPIIEAIGDCSYQDIEDMLAFFLEYSGVQIKSLSFLKHILQFEKSES